MPNAVSKPNPHANVYCNSSMCDHANAARWIGLQLDLLMSALPALLEELHCLAEVLLKGRAQDCALLCQLALKARSLIGQLPLRMRSLLGQLFTAPKLCLPYETLSENSYIIYNIRHRARSLRRKRSGVPQG